MLKRLARILIILIILVGLYRYTSIFDNTKIKPYLEKLDNRIVNIFSKNSTGSQTITDPDVIEDNLNNIDRGLTGASPFNDNDILEGAEEELSGNMDGENINQETEALGNKEENVTEVNSAPTEIIIPENGMNTYGCFSPWGEKVTENGYIIAYARQVSPNCEWERRYCNDSKLAGTYQFDTCYYSNTIAQQQQSSLLTQQEVKSLQEQFGLTQVKTLSSSSSDNNPQSTQGLISSSNNSQGEIFADGITGNDSNQSNSLKTTNNDPDKHFVGKPTKGIEILSNGWTQINDKVLKSNSLQKQLQGKQGVTFITNSKTIDVKNTYSRKVCATPRGSLISNGQFVYAYKNSTAQNGVCQSETRFCLDGKLQGSFTNSSCSRPQQIPNSNNIQEPVQEGTIVGFTETRNILRDWIYPLELMPSPKVVKDNTPDQTIVSVPTINYETTPILAPEEQFNTVGQSYLIYHQPDEVDHGNQPPEYMFIGAGSIQ